MADMISAADAKNILGCDDATLNNHINNGSIRAQRAGGQLQVSKEDVMRLSSGSDSDDGTLILASESDDFSIDLGEVIDDSAATMVHGGSDDAAITFNESEGLEMPDLDGEATQDMGTTDATSDLSFTESNTAVVTSVDETMVDETMVDQTAADLQTVDYGDSEFDSPRRSSGRVSQRSVRSQRVAEFEDEPVHTAWPVLMGLTMFIMLFTIPYIYMMSWPGDETVESGEKLPGTADGMFTNMASNVIGFSVEPDPEKFKQTADQGVKHMPMGKDFDPQGGKWRYKQSLNGAGDIEERIKHYRIQKVEVNDSGTPESAINKNNQAVQIQEVKVETEDGSPAKGVYEAVIPY